jgi:hypothetical protein
MWNYLNDTVAPYLVGDLPHPVGREKECDEIRSETVRTEFLSIAHPNGISGHEV